MPLSRLRLNTTVRSYLSVLHDLALGKTMQGTSVPDLERRVASSLGIPYALCMPMARVGIYLVIRALIKPGQKVVLSPYTITDVVNMVICAGGVPVFADIERETCNINPDNIERLIDDQTGAVMITHFHGLACDMERIVAICSRHEVPLVEDAAQAFGSRTAKGPVGTLSDAGIYSFGMFKNATSFLGGMVVTPHRWLHDRLAAEMAEFPYQPLNGFLAKLFRAFATDMATLPLFFRTFSYWIFRYAYLHDVRVINELLAVDVRPEIKQIVPDGYLRQMTPTQARLVGAQLTKVERENRARIEAARIYHMGLSDLDELILPPPTFDGSHVFYHYPIQYSDRDALIRYAMEQFRDLTVSHHKNCAALDCFREYAADCPNAAETARCLIYLPTYPSYPRTEIEKNIAVVRRFFGQTA